MIAQYEERHFENSAGAWVGKYKALQNLAHWHKETELIFVMSGRCTVGINGEIYSVESGRALLCHSGDIHYISSESESIVYVLIFSPQIAQAILQYKLLCPLIQHEYDYMGLFTLLQQELKTQLDFFNEKIRCAISDFMIPFFRNQAYTLASPSKNAAVSNYQKLISYIDNHFDSITFSEAADIMHFTPAYFSTIFTALSGITFTKYLTAVRIEKAVELLKASDLSITQISISCGFNTIRHFNRVFKDVTGMTPKDVTSGFVFHLSHMRVFAKDSEGFNPTLSVSQFIE